MLLASGILHDPEKDINEEDYDEEDGLVGIVDYDNDDDRVSTSNSNFIQSSLNGHISSKMEFTSLESAANIGAKTSSSMSMSMSMPSSSSSSPVPKLNFSLLGKGRQKTPRDSTLLLGKTKTQEQQHHPHFAISKDDHGFGVSVYETALATARKEVQEQEIAKTQKREKRRESVMPATNIAPEEFERKWHALPIASSVRMDLFVLPTPDAVFRFVKDRHFHVVASGYPTRSTLRVFVCATVERRSGAKGGCLFLAELVLDMAARRMTATYKIERRKYLATFLAVLALHQLDDSLSTGGHAIGVHVA
jgi:hypothetical protein